MKVAQGTKDPAKDGLRQIAIRFPEENFRKIAAAAAEAGLPFAEYVRLLVDRGMQPITGA